MDRVYSAVKCKNCGELIPVGYEGLDDPKTRRWPKPDFRSPVTCTKCGKTREYISDDIQTVISE